MSNSFINFFNFLTYITRTNGVCSTAYVQCIVVVFVERKLITVRGSFFLPSHITFNKPFCKFCRNLVNFHSITQFSFPHVLVIGHLMGGIAIKTNTIPFDALQLLNTLRVVGINLGDILNILLSSIITIGALM